MKKIVASAPFRVARRLIRQYFEDGVARSSAELAYYLLFSIFPFIVFVNGLLSRFNLDAGQMLASLGIMLPTEIVGIFSDYLEYISGLNSGVMLYSGLFLTFYMMLRAIRSLTRSVTRAYRLERRGFVNLLISLAMSLMLLISIFVLFALIMLSGTLLEAVGRHISLSPEFIALAGWLRYIFAPVFMFLVLAVFYRAAGGPKYSLKNSIWGAIFFVVFWVVATMGFSYYVSNMSNYSLLYGSIGAIMILMLWLYITGILLIMGGAFNRVLALELRPDKEKEGEEK